MTEFLLQLRLKPAPGKPVAHAPSRLAGRPHPAQYLTIFTMWGISLLWFHPRLVSLMDMATSPAGWIALLFFIAFVELAWLYGFYNIGVIVFALINRRLSRGDTPPAPLPPGQAPGVAILYTTCNDFVEESAASCVRQEYPDYHVYILDDSSDPAYLERVEAFARAHPERVSVVRRADRRGFKAGNLNHGLAHAAVHEPYFAIADADEILPVDFLSKLIPYLEADPEIGFVQANHRANPDATSPLARALGAGIDIHWKWYQPLRNRFGFVMFLGHGAVIRRAGWETVGGFPELVSEDLAFAMRLREHGWRGRFVEEVVCYEDFPETVRAFRVRHIKWTRGTCEFLTREMGGLLRSRRITWSEKWDILFPTLNLPLTLFYFLFMIDANLILPMLFGSERPLTLTAGGSEVVVPVMALDAGFNAIYSGDFFLITLMTFLAPVLCFVLAMWRTPIRLFRFLCHSTALYAALGPLSAFGVASYLVTGKATFLVTGDTSGDPIDRVRDRGRDLLKRIKAVFDRSHPDHWVVQTFEVACGVAFAYTCLQLFQISFLGMSLAFAFMPVMHRLPWKHGLVRRFSYVPLLLVLAGLMLGGFALLGLPTLFFSFGFHF